MNKNFVYAFVIHIKNRQTHFHCMVDFSFTICWPTCSSQYDDIRIQWLC